jgi:hypothetical protein
MKREMKTHLQILLFSTAAILSAGCDQNPTYSSGSQTILQNKDSIEAAKAILTLEGRTFTEAEMSAFGQSTEIALSLFSSNQELSFVRILRPNPAKESVPWTEIEKVVRAGQVVEGFAPHSRDCEVYTKDGRCLNATAPSVDTLSELFKEVDPKGIFMSLSIE